MDYIPNRSAEIKTWASTLSGKMVLYSLSLGLTEAEVTEVQLLCQNTTSTIQNADDAWADYQEKIKTKNELDTIGSLRKLRMKIAGWKTLPGYTQGIGAGLGIVGESTSTDLNGYKANLSANVMGGFIRLKFLKNGSDGINIYRRRKGSADWVFQARDTSSPYDDHITLEVAGQPEHFEYIAYGVKKDEQFGEPSDIVQVVYGAIA